MAHKNGRSGNFIPAAEAARLRLLERFGVAEEDPGVDFSHVVPLLSCATQCPVAFVSFVGQHRQWFAAETGLGLQRLPRHASVCATVVAERAVRILGDVKQAAGCQRLFAEKYPPGIRFYAAAPILTSDGYALGTVGVMDYEPRADADDRLRTVLTSAAAQVMQVLEFRRRLGESQESVAAQRDCEAAISHERDLLQKLIDHLPESVYVKDSEGRYIIDNVAHREFFGLENRADVVGKTVYDFFPPELAKRYETADRRVLESGEPIIDQAEPRVDPSGQPREASTSKLPLYNADNQVSGVIGITRDVTSQKQAEEALSQERYVLRALMDNIPDNIYFKDIRGRFIRINKALANWFGLSSPEEAVGKTDFDFFTPEHARQAFEDEQHIIQTGEPLVGKEERETWPGERVTWVSTTKEPLRDQNGQIIGTFGISRDITKLKQATLEIAERDERMQEELRVARAIHHALLPVEAPRVDGLEFGLRFVPSGDIGGDFVDFIEFPEDHRIGIMFADITGHGVGAALLSSMLKVLVDDVVHTMASQSDCFHELNRRLYQEYPSGSYASSFYALFDARRRVMSYVKASQEPAVVIRGSGGAEVLSEGGPALGILCPDCFTEREYDEHTVQLEPGDTVFFFTDGVVEFSKPSGDLLLPRKTLYTWLQEDAHLSPQDLVDRIYERVMTYAKLQRPTDDIALLAVRATA